MKFAIITLLLSTTIFMIGCEDEDLNSIAQAQNCLDSIAYDASAATLYDKAQECQEYVKGINTVQASIIKCSSEFIKGGVSTKRMVEAMTRLEQSSDPNNEASFMGALALNGGASPNQLVSHCNASGVTGLKYLASLSYMGTRMAIVQLGGGYPNAGEEFPAGYPTNSADMLTDCYGDSSSCNNAETGEVVYQLKDSYCVGDNKDTDICNKINTATESSGVESSGDYGAFMDDLLTQLQ